MASEYVIVTDWNAVAPGDFYLQDEWGENCGRSKRAMAKLRKQAKNGELFHAYRVKAVTYCVYAQMDADGLIITDDHDVMIEGEGAVITNEHADCWEDGG